MPGHAPNLEHPTCTRPGAVWSADFTEPPAPIDGRVVTYDYSNSRDAMIGRPTAVKEGAATLETDSCYLGLGHLCAEN
jgi:hypothetical protein